MEEKIKFIIPMCMHRSFVIKWAYYALCFTQSRLIGAVIMTQVEYTKGTTKGLVSPKAIMAEGGLYAAGAMTGLKGAGPAFGAIGGGVAAYYAAKGELAVGVSRARDLLNMGLDKIVSVNKDNLVFDYAAIKSLAIDKGSDFQHASIVVNSAGKEYKFAIETDTGMPHKLPDDIMNGYITSIKALLGDKVMTK